MIVRGAKEDDDWCKGAEGSGRLQPKGSQLCKGARIFKNVVQRGYVVVLAKDRANQFLPFKLASTKPVGFAGSRNTVSKVNGGPLPVTASYLRLWFCSLQWLWRFSVGQHRGKEWQTNMTRKRQKTNC